MLPHRVSHGRILALLAIAATPLIAAADLPTSFGNEVVLSNLRGPISMTFLPDGRFLLLEKHGEMMIADAGALPATADPYMTINNINDGGERGLIDIALHPDFATNNWFYLYYSRDNPARFRISRFTHLGNTGDLASEVLIWEDNEDFSSCCHYGGGLAFGPDGNLYLTTGEEFDGGQSQDLARAGGKIIRLTPDGGIPFDNPFIDGPDGNLDEVWAYGLRNPFRAAWDPPTGRLLIGEVGGNTQAISWEDVHLGEAGANYGWPQCEGPCGNTDFPGCDCATHEDPIFSYPHSGAGASVTGGFVYRGNQFPSAYTGAYFYGDFVRQFIRYVTFDPTGTIVTGDSDFEPNAGPVVHLCQSPDGSLYYINISGEVRRIVFQDGNQSPVITQATADVTSGVAAPLDVQFTGTATDAEMDPLVYHWVFGDGQTSDQQSPLHTYAANGIFDAHLEVSDNGHTTVSDPVRIEIGQRPAVTIQSPAEGALFRGGDTITFAADANDPDGVLTDESYAWTVEFIHNAHAHPALGPLSGSSGTFEIPVSGHDFSDNTGYRFSVTVTDADGLSETSSVSAFPEKVDVLFDTIPSGQTIVLDTIPRATPLLLDTMIGFEHQVSVPPIVCWPPPGQRFDAWSDGGDPSHVFVVPEVNAALVASYTEGEQVDCDANGLFDSCELLDPLGAVAFDGFDDWVNIPDLSLAGDFTIEAWVRIDGTISNADALVGQEGPGPDINFASARARLFAPGDVVVAETRTVSGVWTHYCFTRAGTTLTLYINGVFDAVGVWEGGAFSLRAIGRGNAGTLGGALDEFRVWDIARAPEDILASYDRPLPPDTPGLLAYWKFNENAPDQSVFDSTPFERHATLGTTANASLDDPRRETSGAPLAARADCDGDLVPDECQPDDDGDGVIDPCDLCPGSADYIDHNDNGVPDGCELTCPGDADGDEDVDLSDLASVLGQFGQTGSDLAGDVDRDGDVDLTDLGILLANFGTAC